MTKKIKKPVPKAYITIKEVTNGFLITSREATDDDWDYDKTNEHVFKTIKEVKDFIEEQLI